ncbi:methyl-accepting chemotaxis protein [Aliishimia ponticola]|nr:methyl-accepting chemotaxis protein [Aliishimia ponticola]
MTYLSARTTRIGIEAEATAKLESTAALQATLVSTLLQTIDRDLQLQATSELTSNALDQFSSAFAAIESPMEVLQRVYITDNPHPTGEKDKLTVAGNGSDYDALHARYHPYFHRLQQTMGYYDVFLFDTDGNLVYSVFKELDYATNLNTGEWKDTDLGNVFRRALNLAPGEPAVFEDFEPYGPSFGAAAAFIARPVFSESGERLGVLAFQMPVGELNATVARATGLGETGEAFLLGEDGLMRTDSLKSVEDDVLATRVPAEVLTLAFQDHTSAFPMVDRNGNHVTAYVETLSFLGTNWALVAKQDTAELFAKEAEALRSITLNGAIMFIAALGVTVLLSKSIAAPLAKLAKAVRSISDGAYDTTVENQARTDEIGDIGRAVETFRGALSEAAEEAHLGSFISAGFEVSGAPMILADTDFRIFKLNTAAKKMMRERADDFRQIVDDFDPEGLVGQHMDMFHANPAKNRATLAAVEKLPAKLKLSIGNAYVGLLVDKVEDRNGKLVGYILEWRDQTNQMANQVILQAIDTQQCRMEMALDGRIKSMNDLILQTIQKPREKVLGMDATTIIRPLDGEEDFWPRVSNGESVHQSFLLKSDAGERIIDGSISPVPNHKGEVNGCLLLGVDATETHKQMHEAEEQRKRMQEEQSAVVEKLSVKLKQLAVGDLTCAIKESFAPDYEQLRADFNEAVDKLKDAMRSVVANAEQIDDEATAISSAVHDLSHRTERQAATLEETATAVEELTASVTSAASGAQNAADIASAARNRAKESGQVVGQAVSAMHAIETSSNEISKIISVIDDIAFQTNLLALNAGVEAARAGEAGRGFAVVASEVRALAQRSLEAAGEINTLITSSGDQVKQGVSLVADAGTALDQIVNSVAEISDVVNNIATSAAEQSSGIGEINTAMSQLDETTQRNAAMVEETTAASQALAAEAQTLVKTTGRFDVGNRNAAAAPSAPKQPAPAPTLAPPPAPEPKPAPAASAPPLDQGGYRSQGSAALAEEPAATGWEEF